MFLFDLLVGVNGLGNLNIQLFMLWNYDVVIEWYFNEDFIFVFGVYYKCFIGGF